MISLRTLFLFQLTQFKKFKKNILKKSNKMALHSYKMLKDIYTYNNKNIFAIFDIVFNNIFEENSFNTKINNVNKKEKSKNKENKKNTNK